MNNGIIYHVEMDAHYCTPIKLEDAIEEIKSFMQYQNSDNK
jgi:hypothetical protein